MTIAYKQAGLIESAKRIFTLALPMSGSQLINVSSGFLTMSMLAHLGPKILAASALIYSTQLSLMVSGLSILFSLGVLISRAYGAKNFSAVGSYLRQGWSFALIVCIPVILVFWNIDKILIFFGQSPELAAILKKYFHVYVFAVPFGFLSACNQQFGYGIHKKLLMVFTSILSVTCMLITAWTLIFGKFGFPKLGVEGLAIAIIVQYVTFFLFSTLFYFFEKSFRHFEIFNFKMKSEHNHFREMLRVGWPMSVQMGGEMLSFWVSSIMIGWLGAVSLAAIQVVNQYYFLIVVPIFSLSQASGMLVGHAYGAKQLHQIKVLGQASILIVLIASTIVAAVFLLFPKQLAMVYMNVNDPALKTTIHLIVLLFIITAFSQLLDSIRNISTGLLRGLLDTRIPMIISLLAIWIIGLPLSYFLGFTLHYGVVGFWAGGLIDFSIAAIGLLYRWHVVSNRVGVY